MKRIGWFVAPLLVLAVSAGTAVAGGKNCSAANTQECLDYMSKTYKNRGWIERPGMANFVLSLTQKPNKALEPTSTSVTPRAIE